jgi:D-lactate dehydrogenase
LAHPSTTSLPRVRSGAVSEARGGTPGPNHAGSVVFFVQDYEIPIFDKAASDLGIDPPVCVTETLGPSTVGATRGASAVIVSNADTLDHHVLTSLAAAEVGLVAFRQSGVDNIDLADAAAAGLRVSHVAAYGPSSVAEFTVGAMLQLLRNARLLQDRVASGDWRLHGVIGREISGRVVGVIGAGAIGTRVIGMLAAMRAEILVSTPRPDRAALESQGAKAVSFDELLARSEVITVHAPLTAETNHLLDSAAFARMADGVFLVNAARGGLVDLNALIDGLHSGKVAGAALDVFEGEEAFVYGDHTGEPVADARVAQLLGMSNVILTPHLAGLTVESVTAKSRTVMAQVNAFFRGDPIDGELR